MRWVAITVALVLAVVAAYLFWPVCVPLSAPEVALFQPPITERTDRDFHLWVFQKSNDRWLQCKTRLSRAFFF